MVQIRSASIADAPDIARIYATYVAESPASFELDPPTAEEMARRIQTSLSKHAWLVGSDDNAIVGYAYGTTARARAAYRFTVEVSVYLDAGARGRGIGKALMSELLDKLAGRGYMTVIAGITLPNDASVRLFGSLGFDSVGVYRKIGYKFGRWHDVGWWQRSLVSAYPDSPAEVPLD